MREPFDSEKVLAYRVIIDTLKVPGQEKLTHDDLISKVKASSRLPDGVDKHSLVINALQHCINKPYVHRDETKTWYSLHPKCPELLHEEKDEAARCITNVFERCQCALTEKELTKQAMLNVEMPFHIEKDVVSIIKEMVNQGALEFESATGKLNLVKRNY